VNIVLASGFLIPQQFLGLNYFRDVKPHLELKGHTVLPPVVPPLAKCVERATILADKIAERFGNDPVHIIAHSMGGLDCRVMIGNGFRGLDQPGRVLSLTTLSTPHQGSPVADQIVGDDPDDAGSQALDLLDALHVDTGALRDLTAAATRAMPDIAKTHPHIRIRSFAASGRTSGLQTCVAMKATYDYVKAKTHQDNDGVVAVGSSRYGEFQEPTWPCDHIEMVGYDLDTLLVPSALERIWHRLLAAIGLGRRPFDHLAKFDMIVDLLQSDS
jgi:triacylglycerol lipase